MPEPSAQFRELFLRSLFRELLYRDPLKDELAAWLERSRTMSDMDIYFEFAHCTERRAQRGTSSAAPLFRPPGHFYSPVVDVGEVLKREAQIFGAPRRFDGFDLQPQKQIAFAERLPAISSKLQFPDHKTAGRRYHYINPAFSYGDATILAAMILFHSPAKIMEVGSGYSSALTLDIVEKHLAWQCDLTFIDPYPELLESLLSSGDRRRVTIIPSFVQDVPLESFDTLGPGDILFIDTTHVVKTARGTSCITSGSFSHIMRIMRFCFSTTTWCKSMAR
jgi:hypothetical protein